MHYIFPYFSSMFCLFLWKSQNYSAFQLLKIKIKNNRALFMSYLHRSISNSVIGIMANFVSDTGKLGKWCWFDFRRPSPFYKFCSFERENDCAVNRMCRPIIFELWKIDKHTPLNTPLEETLLENWQSIRRINSKERNHIQHNAGRWIAFEEMKEMEMWWFDSHILYSRPHRRSLSRDEPFS